MKKMKNIAIIPARSGSKGLINKNIKWLAGKPLMAYSIITAIESGQFDTVMVSTDSQKYADIAKEFGADVPFLRSEKASSDTASSWDAVEEVLNNYKAFGKTFDTFMLLQPTSPLRTTENIIEAFEEMDKKKADSIISLCEADHSPELCNTLPENKSLTSFWKNNSKGKRRQDLPIFYRINGAIYLAKTSFFIEDHNIYRDNCYAYLMNKRDSVDIDDELDFIIAETIMSQRAKKTP